MIITFYHKKSPIKPNSNIISEKDKPKRKKKLSTYDFIEIAGNLIVFCQLFSYSITIKDGGSVLNNNDNNQLITNIQKAFSFLSFNISPDSLGLFSLSHQSSAIIQLNIYFLIILLATITEIFLILDFYKTKLKIENKKWFPRFKKILDICMKISEGFFIPISVTFFKVYSCAHETDNVAPFLEYYCQVECWGKIHISLLILLTILFLFYSIFFLIYLEKYKDIKSKSKGLSISKGILYSQSQIFFRMMVSGISIMMSFDKGLMASFNLFMFFSMFISSFIFKPYGKIAKLNRLVLGLLLILFANSFLSFLTFFIDINTTIAFLCMWVFAAFLIIINVNKGPNIIVQLNDEESKNISRTSMVKNFVESLGKKIFYPRNTKKIFEVKKVINSASGTGSKKI